MAGVPTVLPERTGDLMESGRGLRGVSKLAMAIGIYGSRDVGHTVWADLDMEPDPEPRPDLVTLLAV